MDYQELPRSITIPAGAASATITLKPIDDALLKSVGVNGDASKSPIEGAKAADTGEGTRYGRRPKRPEKAHVESPKKPQQ